MRPLLLCSMMIAMLGVVLTEAEAGQQKPVHPSFDCHQTTTAVERVICSHDELATLDLEMMRLYRDAVTKAPRSARKHLQTEQARWLDRRNACTETASRTMQRCIEAEYQARLQQLSPHP